MGDTCRDAFEKYRNTECPGLSGTAYPIWKSAWNARANDKSGEAVAYHLGELIVEYWEIAYAEGKEGRTEDTPSGSAQKCWTEIWKCLCDVAEPPRATASVMDVWEQAVKDHAVVTECVTWEGKKPWDVINDIILWHLGVATAEQQYNTSITL